MFFSLKFFEREIFFRRFDALSIAFCICDHLIDIHISTPPRRIEYSVVLRCRIALAQQTQRSTVGRFIFFSFLFSFDLNTQHSHFISSTLILFER